MLKRVTAAAARIGALSSRISLQSDFTQTLLDSIDVGIGRLVDAAMEDTAARLNALKAQQQLAVQALGIANSGPGKILQLFQ